MMGFYEFFLGLLNVFVKYRTLSKTGESGWKVLIPIYSDYLFAKKADAIKWFRVALFGYIGQFFVLVGAYSMWKNILIQSILKAPDSGLNFSYLFSELYSVVGAQLTVVIVAFLVLRGVLFVGNMFAYMMLAKRFGKRPLLGVIMALFPVVGFGVIAFSPNARYSTNPLLTGKDL